MQYLHLSHSTISLVNTKSLSCPGHHAPQTSSPYGNTGFFGPWDGAAPGPTADPVAQLAHYEALWMGHWQGGRLVSGHYRRLASATTGPDGFIQLEWEPEQAECRLGDIQS